MSSNGIGRRLGWWVGVGLVIAAAPFVRAQGAQTFAATASVKTGATTASAPVSVVIDRLSTEAERTELMATMKKGGHAAAKTLLTGRPSLGTIQVGSQRTPIKYAFDRGLGSPLITIVTAEPIAVAGSGLPEAKPKAGFDLGLALLVMSGAGPGQGELSPAAKIRMDDKGGVVTEDTNAGAVIQLTNVVKK